MSIKIKINPIAATDLHEIKEYITKDNPKAALKTIQNIIMKIEDLKEFPEMGALLTQNIKLKSNYRYLVYGNYLIFYIYEKDTVFIQRILHAKRDYINLLGIE